MISFGMPGIAELLIIGILLLIPALLVVGVICFFMIRKSDNSSGTTWNCPGCGVQISARLAACLKCAKPSEDAPKDDAPKG